PDRGQDALSVAAVGSSGTRITLPILRSAGMFASENAVPRKLHGPTRIQRRILHPTIAWYLRGERRGVPINEVRRVVAQRIFDDSTQLVKPDPESNALVGLAGQWCIVVVTDASGAATGCDSSKGFWSRGPLNVIGSGEGDQFARFSGAAADGVRRIVIFLGD